MKFQEESLSKLGEEFMGELLKEVLVKEILENLPEESQEKYFEKCLIHTSGVPGIRNNPTGIQVIWKFLNNPFSDSVFLEP